MRRISAALVCLAFGLSVPLMATAQQAVKPDTRPVLEITKDTTLDPAKTYGRIVIKQSGVKIDGAGAWVVGATAGDPKTTQDVGVSAKGVSNVTLQKPQHQGLANRPESRRRQRLAHRELQHLQQLPLP